MPTFTYRARDASGKLVRGTLEAENQKEALRQLQKKQLFITDLKEDNFRIIKWNKDRWKKTSVRDLAIFCRQFSTMIDAGLPILSSLLILKDQTDHRLMRQALEEVAGDLQKGKTLTQALEAHPRIFPHMMVNMVEAGEVSGVLDEVLFRLSLYLETEYSLGEKIRTALIYPVVILVVALLAVIFLLIFVLPVFQGIFSNLEADMPLVTRIILKMSLIIRNYWYVGFVFIYLITVGANRFFSSERGQLTWSQMVLRVPIFGDFARKAIISRFARTLATLLRGGVPILQALEIAKGTTDNKMVVKALAEAQEHVRDGGGIAAPLARCGIFPPMVIQMIAIGEETGTIDQLLEKISQFYDWEIDNTVNRLASILEPLLLLLLGGIVGFLILGIMLPMFKIIGSI